MQRLGTLLSTRAAPAYGTASVVAQRFVNKKAAEKVTQNEDDVRWLEAEIDANINSPEELYAHEREVRILKSMVSQLQEDHSKKLDNMKADRDREVESLKQQMSSIEDRLRNLQSQK